LILNKTPKQLNKIEKEEKNAIIVPSTNTSFLKNDAGLKRLFACYWMISPTGSWDCFNYNG
jgi:hypothetical protein